MFLKNKSYSIQSKLFSIIILFMIISSPVNADTQRYIQAQYIMGTIYKIEVYSDNKTLALDAINKAFDEIRKCDLILSNYRNDSELTKIQDEAYNHPVKVSDDFFEITKRSIYFSKITNGMFDITVEPLVKLWGFKNKDFKKPSQPDIDKTLKEIGYQNIILDEKNKTIFFKRKINLDFGGIGKGFAVGKAASILKKMGIKSAVVDSVSSQYYIGSPPNQKYWKVGIKNPRNQNNIIKYIYLKDKAVSTSGDYEQYFIGNGIRYSHNINPKTGYPIQEKNISATIIMDNATDSDALSSSVRMLDTQQTKKLIKLFPSVKVFETKNDKGKIKFFEYN